MKALSSISAALPVLVLVMSPIFSLFSVTSPLAQETQSQVLKIDGKDFPVTVMSTASAKEFGYYVPTSRWPSLADGTTVVYVCWENYSSIFESQYQLVHDAVISTWQENSKLEFRGWKPCTAESHGIRIYTSDEGPHTKGLGRDLDRKPQGMVLNFTFNSWSQTCKDERDYCIKTIAVHEFGHAIGFAHEQNRPDTPGECRRAQGSSVGAVMLTPYDPHSVMNYCNKEYNNNGVLSDLDLVALHKIYGVR